MLKQRVIKWLGIDWLDRRITSLREDVDYRTTKRTVECNECYREYEEYIEMVDFDIRICSKCINSLLDQALIKLVSSTLAKEVLMQEDYKDEEMDGKQYLSGCENLKKNKMLQYLLKKMKRELILKMTRTSISNMSKDEDLFYRGGLYVLKHMEQAIEEGARRKELLEDLEEE